MNNTWCTIHRVWYGQTCERCEAEDWVECTKVFIDGVDRDPCDALRRARRVAGKSQKLVVEEAGLGQGTVWKWEAGHTAPRIDLWLRALNACGYRVIVERGPNLAMRGARRVELEAAQPVTTTSA